MITKSAFKMSRVTILIVTYNCGNELDECISSIPVNKDVSICVVDNCSTNNVIERLEKYLKTGLIHNVIYNNENVGFARAVNIGLSKIPEGDIVLMNPDATMDDKCLEELSRHSASDPAIGLLTPVVYSGRSVRTMSAGMQPTIRYLFAHYSGLSRVAPHMKIFRGRYLFLDKHGAQDLDIEWAAGCCLYIPRSTLAAVGVLSERWFMYGEDIEYCKRVLDSGRKIRLVSSARAFHEMGVAVRAAGGPVSTMWPRNTFDYYCVTYKPGVTRRLVWKLVFSGGLGSRALLLLLRSPSDREIYARSKRLWTLGMAVWYT